MKNVHEQGSHIIAISLGILVIGVIGFAGWRIAHRPTTTATNTQTVTTPATIESTTDLQNASESLDTSNSGLDSDMDSSALNADLNDLL
jgi:hypothetical protein